MMTLLEIEERQDDILVRLEELGDLIAESAPYNIELSRELADLVLELATLRANIVFYSEMAEALVSMDCTGGPH
mgnify:FL=1